MLNFTDFGIFHSIYASLYCRNSLQLSLFVCFVAVSVPNVKNVSAPSNDTQKKKDKEKDKKDKKKKGAKLTKDQIGIPTHFR